MENEEKLSVYHGCYLGSASITTDEIMTATVHAGWHSGLVNTVTRIAAKNTDVAKCMKDDIYVLSIFQNNISVGENSNEKRMAGVDNFLMAARNASKFLTVKNRNNNFKLDTNRGLPHLFQTEHIPGTYASKLQINYSFLNRKHYDLAVCGAQVAELHVTKNRSSPYYTFINCSSNGTYKGMINAFKQSVVTATNNAINVRGQGAISKGGDLKTCQDMIVPVRKCVSNLKKAGRELQETIAATATRALDSTFGHCLLNGDFLQSVLMLVLYLPRVAMTITKAYAGTTWYSRSRMFMELNLRKNKWNDQKQ